MKNDKKFIGQTIRIIKGPLQGKIGIIKDLKADGATIELHSEFKTVKVSKENFKLCNADGQMIDSPFGGSVKVNYTPTLSERGSKTSNNGSETPCYRGPGSNNRYSDTSRTPQIDSYTPRIGNSENQTPRYGAFDPLTATPAYHLNYDNDKLPNTPAYATNNYSDDDEDDETGNWYSKKNNEPDSPKAYSQTRKSNSPDSASSLYNKKQHKSQQLVPLRKLHIVKNVEVLVRTQNNDIKRAVILGERNGSVSVNVTEDKKIINVTLNSVFRKEPESGNNIIYFNPSSPTNYRYGKCLTAENDEAVTKFNDGEMKILSLKDIAPYYTEENHS